MQTWVTWLQAMWLTRAFPDIEIISIIYLPFCFVALVKPIDKRNYHGPHKRWSKLMWPFQHVMICRVHEIYIFHAANEIFLDDTNVCKSQKNNWKTYQFYSTLIWNPNSVLCTCVPCIDWVDDLSIIVTLPLEMRGVHLRQLRLQTSVPNVQNRLIRQWQIYALKPLIILNYHSQFKKGDTSYFEN